MGAFEGALVGLEAVEERVGLCVVCAGECAAADGAAVGVRVGATVEDAVHALQCVKHTASFPLTQLLSHLRRSRIKQNEFTIKGRTKRTRPEWLTNHSSARSIY